MPIQTPADASQASDTPSAAAKDAPARTDAPGGGEIEWAGGFITVPPSPGEASVSDEPDVGEKPAAPPLP